MHQLGFLIRIQSARVCGLDSQPLSKPSWPSSERPGKAILQGNSFNSFLGRERTLTSMGPSVSQTLCLGGQMGIYLHALFNINNKRQLL